MSYRCERRGELEVIVIDHALGYAEICLQGAQLIAYRQRGEKNLIWRSRETSYASGVPIRGGIPLIGPWFGPIEKNPIAVQAHIENLEQSASHGFLRNVLWSDLSVDESDDVTTVRLSYNYDEDISEQWKCSFQAVVTFHIGAALQIDLKIENLSDREMSMTNALHSYFAVSDISRVQVPSLDGVSYVDALDNDQLKIQSGILRFDREVDYDFLDVPEVIQIDDDSMGRSIVIESNASCAVVWNPWIEKSHLLSMFGDDEYTSMLCVESSNVLKNYISVASGESHILKLKISTMSL